MARSALRADTSAEIAVITMVIAPAALVTTTSWLIPSLSLLCGMINWPSRSIWRPVSSVICAVASSTA